VTTAWTLASSALVEARGVARAHREAWWAYPSAAVLSAVLVIVLMQLWRADVRVPFTYHGEAIYNDMLVKGVLEQGWHLSNPALGAPAGADLRDVPISDNNLHFALIKLLGLGSRNHALVMNAFFLLTFPLTALSALFALRRFGLAAWPALCGSLLYAFLPFHFGRGQHHLFLTAYYLVPLGIMVALWIMLGAVSLLDEARRWSWRPCRGKLLASMIICALIGSGGVYYAFFTCFFFLVAGVVVAFRRGDPRHLVLPAALVAVTAAVLTVNFLPSIIHVAQYGNTPTIRRNPLDAEVYALRISELLLPITGHRLPWVARFKDFLDAERGINESNLSSLGLIGSLGFLALLGRLLLTRPAVIPRDEHVARGALNAVGILNVVAVLVATVGGFGTLMALLVTSKIRAYNRLSIFIAFFAVFAVVVGLDAVDRRYGRTWRGRALLALGFTAVLVLGVLDQTTPRAVANYEKIRAEYGSDATFVHEAQELMPPGAMVFQLPMVPYPENPPVHLMHDYDHGRAYLHSKGLRWSYGAVKGREGEAWQQWVAAKPTPEMIDTLAAAGFSGLYLNRAGYPDRGVRLSREIVTVLEQPPLRSSDDRLLFFDLTAHRQALRAEHPPAQWQAKQDEARHPLLVIWQEGCSYLEGTPEKNYRWCEDSGEWRLINRASHTKRVTFEMTLTSPHPGNLRIESALFSGSLELGPVSRPLTTSASVPPGQHTVRFACDAPRVLAPGDHRRLVFRFLDFKVTEAPRPLE
jgi:phosphoglycerol transferase